MYIYLLYCDEAGNFWYALMESSYMSSPVLLLDKHTDCDANISVASYDSHLYCFFNGLFMPPPKKYYSQRYWPYEGIPPIAFLSDMTNYGLRMYRECWEVHTSNETAGYMIPTCITARVWSAIW